MDQCHVFAEDFRRTLPDVVIAHLSREGVTSYSNRVVDLLIDETFKVVEEHLRSVKEAQ